MSENSSPKETQPNTTENGRFENPWEGWKSAPGSAFFKMIFCTKDESGIPWKERSRDEKMPMVPRSEVIQRINQYPSPGEWQMTWIGHASVLYQADGLNVLCDPIFSNYCSPIAPIGPKRYRPPAVYAEDLPQIDAVIISHNHYDHLDKNSIKDLHRRFGDEITWYVPRGISEFMTSVGCRADRIREMTWWDEVEHTGTCVRPDQKTPVRFVCTPSAHFCNRALHDRNKALWASWSIIGRKKFFFGGDTGYCDGFKEIGRKFGPFDSAAIPIGAYHPREVMQPIHVNPEEAVKIHQDISSQFSMGIHWGTFRLTFEPFDEPPKLLKQYMDALKETDSSMKSTEFITVQHGATCNSQSEQFAGHL